MKIIHWKPSLRQEQAMALLENNIHTEIFYGGGAGGGKSYLGCVWLLKNCIDYPGSRWLMGRAILKSLKESTLLTFFQVCQEFNAKSGVDFKYNAIEGVIKFFNGSTIYLKDLFLYPSDPEFDSLGSTEFTGAFIDEASQITSKAKNIVMSRIRFKLDEFGLIPKLLITSNPSKNFLYFEFYKPSKDGTIEDYRAFIPALVVDNPFISKYYIENLKKLDRVSKERLLYGNFEYDDDPTRLFEYDAIIDLFTSDAERGKRYCIVDVAGYGRDKTAIGIWDGLFLEKCITLNNITDKELDELLLKEKVPRSQCAIDEGGVGFGAVNNLKGVKGFVSNSRPFTKKKETDDEKFLHNYKNLKAQCWFELANYVNAGMIGITKTITTEQRELLVEDLEQIKQKDPGKDAPLNVLSKEDIKLNLGRSTDIGDMLMMRMYFVLNKPFAYDFTDKKPTKSIKELEAEKKELDDQAETELQKALKDGTVALAPKVPGT